MHPADFYTGLVADLYAPLRAHGPDPEPYARFIARTGEPALELGCGDGDPLLELRRRGLQVDGLDSSADMLAKCAARATAEGITVTLHHAPIEAMALGKQFAAIFLAGPTFNLITDDDTVLEALRRIRDHLTPEGAAMIPLFAPPPPPPEVIGVPTTQQLEGGGRISCTPVSAVRDEERRLQTVLLRYERADTDADAMVERPWILHWHTREGFSELAARAGLTVASVVDWSGERPTESTTSFVVILQRAD